MRYLVSTFRILVLVAVVLSIASFSDVNKAQAASGCNASACNITETGTIKMVGNKMFFSGPSNFENKTNISTIISGDIIVTTYGALTFSNLTITNGAKVTQEAIAISDINANQTLKPVGSDKKVDLTVTGELKLTNQGRIDVSGRGFPGGTNAHRKGYGPGGGIDGNVFGLTGGAYGGAACVYSPVIGRCNTSASSYPDVNANGSGGGRNTSRNRDGARGGGIIKITAVNMYFEQHDQVFLKADGANNGGSDVISGGGAGGSIWLNVTNILTTSTPSFGSIKANGYNNDQALSEAYGKDGSIDKPIGFNGNIVANGAKLGGAGGRIKINLAKNPITESCHITSGDIIPASCENQDVTVSGAGTVIEMNKIQINGDSKRKFNNLTVKNGAVITNEALTLADMIQKPDKSYEKSIANQTTGAARWKKVDIEVTGAITFKTGGKIDVTGKGYPGAYFSWDRSGVLDPDLPGCTKDHLGYLVGADGIPPESNTDERDTKFRGNYGFGPGGGIAYSQLDFATGGGGSFGGYGKSGTLDPGRVLNPISYLVGANLDWGSGGGAGSVDSGDRDTTCLDGGAGGGIINLKAKILDMQGSSEYALIANGAEGDRISKRIQDDNNIIASGGGAGGVVRLLVDNILNFAGVSNPISVATGIDPFPDPTIANGQIQNPRTPPLTQISAKGGNGSLFDRHLGTLGAGGGGGYIILGAATGPTKTIHSKKIKAVVTWKEGTSDKTVELYDILRSIVMN